MVTLQAMIDIIKLSYISIAHGLSPHKLKLQIYVERVNKPQGVIHLRSSKLLLVKMSTTYGWNIAAPLCSSHLVR